MKTVNRYIADDDKEFKDEGACQRYEGLCGEVNALLSRLPPRPSGTDFQNGSGYVQHVPETWRAVRLDLLHIIGREMQHDWVDQAIACETTHPSWVARLVDEASSPILRTAWYRIHCTDAQFREWGQAFYAYNPHEGQQVRLNS